MEGGPLIRVPTTTTRGGGGGGGGGGVLVADIIETRVEGGSGLHRTHGLPSDLDDYSSSDGEDDVFIPSANGSDFVGLATKVLLHPRRKSPSGGYQVSQRMKVKERRLVGAGKEI